MSAGAQNSSGGPDFICFGLQKAGTRWLYDQMSSCDRAWMTPVKELNYFAGNMHKPTNLKNIKAFYALTKEEQQRRPEHEQFFSLYREVNPDARDASWYRDLFVSKQHRLSGDISPVYATATDAQIQRVYATCPTAKYIFLLRHPVDRFWSAACMHLRTGRISPDELRNWPSVRRLIQRPNYVARSFPSKIWKRWASHIPANSIRYWFLDDIIADPSRVRGEILSHIGIDGANHDLPSDYNRKSGSEKVPMPSDVAAGLAEWFRQEIADCRKTFGGAVNNWAI